MASSANFHYCQILPGKGRKLLTVGLDWTSLGMHIQHSVLSWLKVKLAQAEKFKLGWLIWACKLIQNPSQARLQIKRTWDIQAKLGLGSEGKRIFELGLAQYWKKVEFLSWTKIDSLSQTVSAGLAQIGLIT